MADDLRMALIELLRKAEVAQDTDFLREGVRVLSQALMELEVSQHLKAERYEHTSERTGQRNGYRERQWDTRVGTIELQVPRVRDSSFFPSLLEPRRRAEQALTAVVQEAYVQGVSTRRVDELVHALGMNGISKSQVSRLCETLDGEVQRFRNRRLEGRYPYVWLDATFVKVRENGRVVSAAVVIAVAVKDSGEREVLAFDVGPSEDGQFWLQFLRSLVARGLAGVQLVISDSHQGLKGAIAAVLQGASWQRCRVHTIRTQFRTRRLVATQVHVTLQWNHMTDLQGVLAHYNTVDQQVQESLLLGKREGLKAIADMLAEGSQTLQHLLGMVLLLVQFGLLPLLVHKTLPSESQFFATLAQFIQADDLGLVSVYQTVVLALQPIERRLKLSALALLLFRARSGGLDSVVARLRLIVTAP